MNESLCYIDPAKINFTTEGCHLNYSLFDSGFSSEDSAQELNQSSDFAMCELPMLASPSQVSEYTGIPTNTLASWRFEGSHLPFVKLGRLIRHRRQDVLNYIDGNVFYSTAEAKKAA